jgi:ribosomal protein L24E
VRIGCRMLAGVAITALTGLAFPGWATAATVTGGSVHQGSSRSRVGAAATSSTDPLTVANAGVTSLAAQSTSTYYGYGVAVNTGCGNSPSFVCFSMPGLGSFTTSPGSPLAPGQVYQNPTLTVTVAGQTCGEFQATGGGYTSAMVVDQFVFNQGTIGSFAVQYVCSNAQIVISGTIAYRMVNSTPNQGYYLYDQFGDLGNFGNDGYLSYLPGPSYFSLNRPIVGMATTPDGGGYWMTGGDGGVFAVGDAAFYGSTGNIHLNKPVVGMAATPDGKGYWFVASDGGIFTFGDAKFYGSLGAVHLNQPVVGMAATPDGKGYWLVAADGGIFAFGDAAFYGSTGNIHLNQPVVGMAPTPDGRGYWFVASDGGIFTFGDAKFFGSTGAVRLTRPITGMLPSPDGRGYLLAADDGGVFAFGDAQFDGSAGDLGLTGFVGLVR